MRVQALLATSDRFVCAKNSGEFGDLYESCFPRANVRGGFNGRWCIDESRCHPCGVINAAPSSRLCEREKEREIRRLRISLAMTISRLFNVVVCKRGRDSRTSFLETSDDVTSRTLLPSTTRVRRHRFIDLITSQLDAGYTADSRVKAFECETSKVYFPYLDLQSPPWVERNEKMVERRLVILFDNFFFFSFTFCIN